MEPEAAPSLTRGVYRYDFGDTGQMTPLVKMHTLGHDFIPEPIHAGGLRYHGMAPLVSLLKELGLIEAQAVHQRKTFESGVRFARPRASCRRPSRPTPSRGHRRGAQGPATRAPARSSCSTCAGTAISTWPPTSATCRAPWSTTSSRPRRCASRSRSWKDCLSDHRPRTARAAEAAAAASQHLRLRRWSGTHLPRQRAGTSSRPRP